MCICYVDDIPLLWLLFITSLVTTPDVTVVCVDVSAATMTGMIASTSVGSPGVLG